jgi:hypothetical protein
MGNVQLWQWSRLREAVEVLAMSNAVRTLKAYRPSAYRDEDLLTERLVEVVRSRNVARYAKMVSEGARLFEHGWRADNELAAMPPGQAPAAQD